MSEIIFDLKVFDPKNVCRFCLSKSQLGNLYSSSIVDGDIIAIPDMILHCLDITVEQEDSLPQQVCSKCMEQITNFHLFKKISKRNEKLLLEIVIKDSEPLKNELEVVEEEPVIEQMMCSVCKVLFEDEESAYKHIQEEHEGDIESVPEENVVTAKDDMDQQSIIEYTYEETNGEVVVSQKKSITILNHTIEGPSNKKRRIGTRNQVQMNSKKPKVSARPTRKVATTINLTEADEIIFDDDDDTIILNTDDMDSNAYECILCGLTFIDKTEYIDHCKEHEFFCDICCKVFETESELIVHRADHEQADDLFCIPCNKRLKSAQQADQHAKMHDSMSLIIQYIDFYPCNECKIIFISEGKLNEHMMQVHSKADGERLAVTEKPTVLKKVDESCTDYQFLDEDKEGAYKEGEYSCGDCDAVYSSAELLKYHVILHAEKFPCPIFGCGCQYDQISRLSIHVLNKHINIKNLRCLHCNDRFNSYDELQKHLKADCREKKFECHECDKKFFSRKALLTHLKTLTDKRFVCQFCGKSFKQQGELKIHNRSHTNERPFQCTICGKAYKTSSMRAAHMDSHISGKTFECTMCDKKLQSRTSYRNHMKRHTEDKKHVCDVCGKKFFTRYHLKLHASKIHEKVAMDDNDTADAKETFEIEIDDDDEIILPN